MQAVGLLLFALAAGLAASSRAAAVGAAEGYFGPTDPRYHERTVSLTYTAPRPGAPRQLVWRVSYRNRGPAGPEVDTVGVLGAYVTPLGRPAGVFPDGIRR